MWENALEKLKILNYEENYKKKIFSRVHFVIPTSNPSIQFDDFIDLCAWLFGEISNDSEYFKRDQFDDFGTVANKLMLALRGIDFRLSFPSQKLKTANGEAACSVLEFLTDKALAEKGFQWAQPIYGEAEEAEQVVDDDEADNEIEDDVKVTEEDVMYEEAPRTDIDETSLDQSAHNIIHAVIDPIEWKTELERVGPKLRAQQQVSNNEWRAHVDLTISSKSHIERVLDETKGDLQSMNRSLSEELKTMETKEKYINNQFRGSCDEYKEVKSELEVLRKKSMETSEVVSKHSNKLEELNDKLEDLKKDSKDSNNSDTSPVVKIKESLQQVKSEVKEFDRRIGVVSHILLQSKISSTDRRRKGAALKARQRKGK
jgi:estrogen-related receptor beta like 1